MASIETFGAQAKFTLQVLEELPHEGFVADRMVGMNSDLGIVRLLFQQTLGDHTWLSIEIMVFTSALRRWLDAVEHMLLDGDPSEVDFDNLVCPHVLLNARRREWPIPDSDRKHVRYEFFAGLNTGYLLDALAGEWGTGPGVWLAPQGETLLAFAQALRQELDAVAPDTQVEEHSEGMTTEGMTIPTTEEEARLLLRRALSSLGKRDED
jgi:hypothetical protein